MQQVCKQQTAAKSHIFSNLHYFPQMVLTNLIKLLIFVKQKANDEQSR